MTPRNAFDRDPLRTYKRMHAEIDRDEKNGWLFKREARKLRSAADRLYLAAKKKK